MHVCISKSNMPCDWVLDEAQLYKKRLGIMGGSFDPVHNGHINIALHAREYYSLHRAALIPLGVPAHKPKDTLMPARHRMEMVRLAVAGTPLEAWDIEINRHGPSYTVDTLEILQGAFGDVYELYFIIGADTLMEIPTWKNAPRVFELCTFLVFYRPGHRVEFVIQQAGMLQECYGAKICLAPHTGPDISSTMIKKLAAKGEDLSLCVPDPVAQYIRKHGLYRSDEA